MGLNKVKLGDYIEQINIRCGLPHLKENQVSGINRDKHFFSPTKQVSSDTSNYKIVPLNAFACNLMHVGRDCVLPISINESTDNLYVSPAYTIFKLKEDKVLTKYLYIFLHSSEKDRYFWFHCDSSVRDGLDWDTFCNAELELPPIEIQRKYVAIYEAMEANLKAYESKLEDLKLVCDGYIEDLKKKYPLEKLEGYLCLCEEKNSDGRYGIDDVKGISIQKEFIETKANMDNVSLKPYLLVPPKCFSYVTVTSRNGNKITLALNNSNKTYIVSSSYVVFQVKDESKLLPEYLFMFFRRHEFDRYARFNSWGSARETFMWEDMCEVTIPIPSIKIQQAIVDIYNSYNKRRVLLNKIKSQLNYVCPVLIKGSIEEASRND